MWASGFPAKSDGNYNGIEHYLFLFALNCDLLQLFCYLFGFLLILSVLEVEFREFLQKNGFLLLQVVFLFGLGLLLLVAL